jgi:hypothetical protein
MYRFPELARSIQASPLPFLVFKPEGTALPIVAANGAMVRLTLYPEAELIGADCRILGGPDTEPEAAAALGRAIAACLPEFQVMCKYRRDGSKFRAAAMIAPVRHPDGSPGWYLFSLADLGRHPGAPEQAMRSEARDKVSDLPPRQRDVLRELVHGLRNKEIAHVLGLSVKTVEMHRAALRESLGVATSAEAIRVGIEAGL